MSIYTDPMIVQTEIDRRFELAGIDRHHPERHHHDLPTRPLGAHPLVAFVAGLVRGGERPAAVRGVPAAQRPRHS